MRLSVGTSGYSYKEWKGNFYPKDIPDKAMLHYYAERFDTVEINNTFYRMPSENALLHWLEDVPEGFSFVLKAPRRITHEKRLKEVADEVAYLLKTVSCLREKLGPLLFQLPPFLKKDLTRLQDFLQLIPEELRVALEFRHSSWFDEEVYAALRSSKAALCVADTDDEGASPLVHTATWGYLRLRRQDYGEEDLRAWAKRIQKEHWEQAFVFFKHEDEGKGPKLAARFLELSL
jgi:uncharacterized protein YecE (DUF72 family)